MKTTIAIIGAGPGLGRASARRFGAEGFNVALLSRTQKHVDALAAELADTGITARGYAADVRDHGSLNAALARAADELGPVAPAPPPRSPPNPRTPRCSTTPWHRKAST